MTFFETIKTVFGLNGQVAEEPEAEPDLEVACPDDEETKMMIELDADEAEELLKITVAEQRASVEPFAMETINLRGRLSDVLKPEGTDDERIPATR